MGQKTRITLYIIRALFFAGAVGIGLYTAKALGMPDEQQYQAIIVSGVLAGVLVVAEAFFSGADIRVVSSIVFGLIIGFLMANLFKGVITVMAPTADKGQIDAIAVPVLVVIFSYLGVTFLLQTKDDFRFIIPYVEFKREARGPRPLILDTSAIIDGRIADLCATRIFESRVVVAKFVIDELHAIADSPDKQRKARARRGFDIVSKLRQTEGLEVDIGLHDIGGDGGVDQKLIQLADDVDGRIVTNDMNLAKVASLQGLETVNLNDLADALKPALLPGEKMRVKLVREGENADQGVGYLDDGTMVVIEKGREKIGEDVSVVVTGAYQTNAGRMIFGRLAG